MMLATTTRVELLATRSGALPMRIRISRVLAHTRSERRLRVDGANRYHVGTPQRDTYSQVLRATVSQWRRSDLARVVRESDGVDIRERGWCRGPRLVEQRGLGDRRPGIAEVLRSKHCLNVRPLDAGDLRNRPIRDGREQCRRGGSWQSGWSRRRRRSHDLDVLVRGTWVPRAAGTAPT